MTRRGLLALLAPLMTGRQTPIPYWRAHQASTRDPRPIRVQLAQLERVRTFVAGYRQNPSAPQKAYASLDKLLAGEMQRLRRKVTPG